MAVQFNGFRQTDVAVSGGSCASGDEGFCSSSGSGLLTLGHRWGGGPKAAVGSANKTFTMATPIPPNNPTSRILFYGSAQMFLDSDYTPATGTGEWVIKLNVITGNANIDLKKVSVCLTDSRCTNLGTIFSESMTLTLSADDTIHVFKGVGTLGINWGSSHRLAYMYEFINNSAGNQSLTYKPNQAMMYPRVGHNQIGLGTGIMHRGDLSVVARQNKRHTLVGQP